MSFNKLKFTKLMELSASPIDGEALNALRFANQMLVEADISWTDLINNKDIIIKEVHIKKEPNPEIEEMLKICKKGVRSSSGQMFIRSLADWYKNHGSLTEKQVDALRKWFDNI